MVNPDRYRPRFAADLALDAFQCATATYWRRRARMLRWAMPRKGDYLGRATREQIQARRDRLEQEAQACENRARVAEMGGA